MWRQLAHTHILTFKGVDQETFKNLDVLCMVSPWLEQGNLLDYLEKAGPVVEIRNRMVCPAYLQWYGMPISYTISSRNALQVSSTYIPRASFTVISEGCVSHTTSSSRPHVHVSGIVQHSRRC